MSLPGSRIPDVDFAGIDKIAHFVLFALWSVSVRRDFGASFRWWACLITGLLFSWATEILQIAVDGRTFDYTDIVADTAGLFFGLAVGKHFLRWLRRYIRI